MEKDSTSKWTPKKEMVSKQDRQCEKPSWRLEFSPPSRADGYYGQLQEDGENSLRAIDFCND